MKEELQSEPVIYSPNRFICCHATHFYYYYSVFFFGWSGLPATCRAVHWTRSRTRTRCPLSLVQRCLLILQLLILFHAVYANEVQKDKAKTAAEAAAVAEAATRHQLSQHLDIKIISEWNSYRWPSLCLSVANANGISLCLPPCASSAACLGKRVAPVKTSSRKKCYCDIELIKKIANRRSKSPIPMSGGDRAGTEEGAGEGAGT